MSLRDPSRSSPLDRYEAIDPDDENDEAPRCYCCGFSADSKNEFGDPICWGCAEEREAEFAAGVR